jgi:trigger factor
MNITRENINNVNAIIKILIEKSDYEKTVEETLKEYRKKSSISGFRPGRAPSGLIKKRFGKAVLVDEINKMLSQNLTKYIMEENLNILGEPLGNKEQQKKIDWDKDENFEFVFDIALAPEIDVPLNKNEKITYYTIKVSDEMIDNQVKMITSRMGQNVKADEVKEKSLVRGNFTELDDEGKIKEEGIRPEGVLIAVDIIKNEEIKKQFLGKHEGGEVIFNPVTAFDNRKEVGRLLNITEEETNQLDSIFKFNITEILEFKEAELNEELYKKLFGDDTEVKTEKDLRNKIKDEIAANLVGSSDRKFTNDAREALIEKINPELPEIFLKRWLKETNEDVSDDQIEKDFPGFLKDLKWQLIKNSIAKENNLKVEDDEAFQFAKELAYIQYTQYGIPNVSEEQLESFTKMVMEKPEEKEKIYTKILENKVIEHIKDNITLKNKKVTQEEFQEMTK